MHVSSASSLNATCGGCSQSPSSGSRLSGPAGLEVLGSSSRLYCPWWSTYSEALEQMLAYRAPWLPASGIRFEHTQLRDGDPAGGQAWWQSHFSGSGAASHCRVTLLEHGSVRRSAPWFSPLQRPFARWAPRHLAGPPETPSSAEVGWKTGLSGCCHSAAVPPPPRSQRHTCGHTRRLGCASAGQRSCWHKQADPAGEPPVAAGPGEPIKMREFMQPGGSQPAHQLVGPA